MEQPSVGAVFPSLARRGTSEMAREVLAYPFSLDDRVALFTAAIAIGVGAPEVDVDELVASADQMLLEISQVAEPGSSAHDLLTFAAATFAAEALQERGEVATPMLFLQRAIALPADEGRWDVRPERLRLWSPPDGRLDPLDISLLEVTLRHLAVFFAHAWRRPALDERAEVMWENATPAIGAALALPAIDGLIDDEAGPLWAVNCALHRIQWALRSGRRDGRAEFRENWEPLVFERPHPSRILRKMLMSFAASAQAPVSDRPQEEWARLLLEEFDGDLTPPVELRALCSACGGREETLFARLPEIRAAAERHREFDDAHEGVVERAYSRSQNAIALAWAMRTLIHGLRLDEALTLLSAWRPDPPAGPPLRSPLFMLPSSVAGTVWATREAIAPNPAEPWPETLGELASSIDRTFNTTIAVRSDGRWDEVADLTGFPVAEEADAYEQIATRHLRLDELERVAGPLSDDAVIVPWPMVPVPVQALTARALDRVWPISASLTEPATARRPIRLAVMGEGSITSALEREAVEKLFSGAGVQVAVNERATRDAFVEAYEDEGVDVLWLCSHGEQDHLRPHRSGLHLDDGFLALGELNGLAAPARAESRLLVLNVCEAGAAPMLEGPLALGVAAVLARANQSIVSHLWPIHPIAAVAFAGLLADALTRDPHPVRAFQRALTLLGRGQDTIVGALEASELVELAQRVRNNEIGWKSILTWGSPTLVC